MRNWRRGLAVAGVLLGGYGLLRLMSQNSVVDLLVIGLWLIGAVAIHDGVVAPSAIGVGRALTRLPPRGRRSVQTGIVLAALLTAVAAPLIYREDTQPTSKALLLRDYGTNLIFLLALVAAASLIAYLVRLVSGLSPATPSAGNEPAGGHDAGGPTNSSRGPGSDNSP